MRRHDRWCLGGLSSVGLRKVLLEASPSAVKVHRENALSRSQAPQEVGSEPVFVIQHLEGEKRGNEPSACNIKVVGPNEDAGQLPPFFQTAPPASKKEVPPVSGSGRVDGEDVQWPQNIFVFGPQVMYLMSQFVGNRFSE